jgi:hypothetical protein
MKLGEKPHTQSYVSPQKLGNLKKNKPSPNVKNPTA